MSTLIKRDSILLRFIKEDNTKYNPVIIPITEDETDDANAIMSGSMTSGNDYDNSTSDSNNTTNDDSNADTNTEEDTSNEENTDNGENNDEGGDDFNIDTSLDSDDSSSDDTSSSDTSSSSTYSSESDQDEVNDTNTEIYSSLTAEEQTQKIMELKNQYKDLYTHCNEFLIKLNNIDVDDQTSIVSLGKVSKTVYNLKNYIKDYFMNTFPNSSIPQNDIMYNRLLAIMSSIPGLLDEIRKKDEKTEHNN